MKTDLELSPHDRRSFLSRAACGFGSLALSSLLAETARAGSPLASRIAHHPPRAKRVIFLFMHGGPSQVDTFDYKPELQKRHEQDYQYRGFRSDDRNTTVSARLGASPWEWRQHGECGQWVSELLPEQAKLVDELCFLKGMHTEGVAHGPATLFLHTGSTNLVRPSMGSWISYGLGTENEQLPAFVTLHPPLFMGGQRNYGTAFLPSVHQGTPIGHAGIPADRARIPFLRDETGRDPRVRREHASLLERLNARQVEAAAQPDEMETAMKSFELAAAMQTEAPELLDISGESEETKRLYGMDRPETRDYGRMCLTARRLSEAGVRFVQVNYSDNHNNPRWDQHSNLKPGHERHAAATDRPVAGLLRDLKRRGLLDDTLVIWSGEFGRTPYSTGSGRDHNPFGFTSWMAGAGVKKGYSHGATDELGMRSVEGRVHMRDFHATILHLLGINHERLTYRHAGRDFRLTDVEGRVVREILA